MKRERGVALPAVCLTCGYGQTSRSNREFDQHDCATFSRASAADQLANTVANAIELNRRLARLRPEPKP